MGRPRIGLCEAFSDSRQGSFDPRPTRIAVSVLFVSPRYLRSLLVEQHKTPNGRRLQHSGIRTFQSSLLAKLHRDAPSSWSPFFGLLVPFSVPFGASRCSRDSIGKCLNGHDLSPIRSRFNSSVNSRKTILWAPLPGPDQFLLRMASARSKGGKSDLAIGLKSEDRSLHPQPKPDCIESGMNLFDHFETESGGPQLCLVELDESS